MAPKKLRFQKEAKKLVLEYESGEPLAIPFELLRVESPSAEVQGHGGERPPPVRGKQDVGVVRAEPVGHYAIRIIFDDGHDSGLFTWEFLKELGENLDERMAEYRARVADFEGR